MSHALKIGKQQNGTAIDQSIPGANLTGAIGVVGGDSSSFSTLLTYAYINSSAIGNAYIVRQKGQSKYLVANITDPTQQAVCVLTNAANAALTEGQMTITALDATSTAVRLARVTNKFAVDFSNTGYYLSFSAANATVQSTGAPTGLYSVLLAPLV